MADYYQLWQPLYQPWGQHATRQRGTACFVKRQETLPGSSSFFARTSPSNTLGPAMRGINGGEKQQHWLVNDWEINIG